MRETMADARDAAPILDGAQLRLCFLVGPHGDCLGVVARFGDRTWESRKAFARALLVLAQARARDEERAVAPPEQRGWMSAKELCALARYEGVNRLNVEVHRARHAFASAGIPFADRVIERRRGTGQLRLGTAHVRMVAGPKKVSSPSRAGPT